MARYRVGNKYLSEQEYEDHIDGNWGFWLFIIGLICGFSLAHNVISYFEINYLEKWQQFSIITCTSIAGGYLFSKLQKIIQNLLFYALVCLILAAVCSFIWDSL